ncbi:sulfurtransferase [Arcobacter sp. CECT 8986]|uniref:rhodanese-like domain-containing protein n=1 Tax=Arcobacter sp. CECT 8986 TaxID=2044507 RepID=UPI001009C0F3|nr:rhodanese-like domain-containing protein [Arcobacter sp. CECT 8986]RXJ98259.1 sulfurtransferase [Arcobacter sp. CECT 8986]
MQEVVDLIPRKVELMNKDNIVLIDVRTQMEFNQTGIIENSHMLTFYDEYGNYNLEEWLEEFRKLVTSKDQTFILICAHANRTRMIGNYLVQQEGYKNCAHLYGGIAQWLQEGRKTVAI